VSIRKALIIPDTHRPFYSRKAYALMLEVASFIQPDEIVLLGDYADFYSVSAHGNKDPRLPAMLQDEVQSVRSGLDELDKLFPKAKKVYLEGNHEFRLERYLCNQAPELFGLTSCRELFEINKRPLWQYQDYSGTQAYRVLGTNLIARHTPLAGNAATGLRRAGQSYIHGHTHQISEVHSVDLAGQSIVALCPGWLGDARSRAFAYMPSPPQWQMGFAIVWRPASSKGFHHEIVEIKKDFSCVTQGKRFKA
jgi:predicted MPP superfamily phosphohydrolase